ncbi:hypothetical protein [Kitasatospora cineracea]|uniref:Extensin-like C-terminal domain-containing protein n=1 Tax=Kitasatospora cineracea TaxID=88074 RepID=A0A8G1UM84_9ACTN|nr:hypothetical protein [Kitasatospora cineracea]ROR46631.1 hypothetical protein EDD39_4915 [Kitasatospora cineracea]
MPASSLPPGRRALLLAGLGGALAACSSGHPSTPNSPSGPNSPNSPDSPNSSPSTSSAFPAPAAWQPGPGELQPDVKLRAVQVVEAIGGWPPGGQGVAAARQRVAALGAEPGLADQGGALLADAPRAALEVVYAQYGGLLADSASVLVVCRQWLAGPDGAPVSTGSTVDVRLSSAAPRWEVTALHPADPGPAAAALGDPATRVLAQPRIALPPAAVADVRSGQVHDGALAAMLALAGAYAFEVSVVRSGHPLLVFGTDRPSDHPQGRAFDTWRIDGRAVVDPATPADLVDSFMRAAAAAGSYNVGGPRLLSGGATANQFFSDATHHDHVHAGFRG